jgi:tRNA dimethylallyltransferase
VAKFQFHNAKERDFYKGANNPTIKIMPKHIIIVGGPTASGKTATAIRLAAHFGTEIISADSRQFYREMSIGTAKPSQDELDTVKHHFIDTLSVTDTYSVGHFEKDALELLKKLFLKHDIVVVAGGSGLFINALCNGLDHFPEVTAEVKIKVDEGIEQGGLPWLQSTVAALDAAYFAKVDPQNPARLRRALEVMWSGGAAYSTYIKGVPDQRDFEVHQILLDWPRPQLYDRINQRVDQMILAGLEDEARNLLPYRHYPALRTVGYEEWFQYFDGSWSKETAIDKMKQHSRNYAKRQMTWFRKYGQWEIFNFADFTKILPYILQSTQK